MTILPQAAELSEPLAPTPAPHRNDWRVLLLLFLSAGIIESQAFGHLSAFTPLYLQQLHVPKSQIPPWTGILSALGFIIGLPLLPLWGVWADRYGRKLIIVRSAYIEGVLFIIAALSPNVYVLAVARFLVGFVFGNTGVMLAMLSDVTPRQRLGLAIGITSSSFPIGLSVGPLLGGLIVQGPGIRTLLGVDAGLSVLMGVVLTLALHEEQHIRAVKGRAGQLLRVAVRGVLASPIIIRLFVIFFLTQYGLSLTIPFLPLLLQQLYHGESAFLPGIIGATLTGAGIAMAVTTPLWGRAGDLVGRWRVLPLCLGAMMLAVIGEAVAPTLGTLQGAMVVGGLFQGGIGVTFMALLALLTPEERRASILNFALLPSQLSWFLGPITGAGLALVALRLPIAMGAGLLGVALVIALILAVQQHHSVAQVAVEVSKS